MDFISLDVDQIDSLTKAGSVTIDNVDRLNAIADIWLWAYSEPIRKADMRAAGHKLIKVLDPVWEALKTAPTVGWIDFFELVDDERASENSLLSLHDLQDVVSSLLPAIKAVHAALEPAPSHRPSEDWILPYVALLLMEYERLGGIKTTGSRNPQIRRGAIHDRPANNRFLFVQTFAQHVKHEFDKQNDGRDPAAPQFIALMTAKISKRHSLVPLIQMADKLRGEPRADFVKRFSVYLQDEVSAVVGVE